jgi:vacuolar-type H+-ATPase subunit H
MADSISPLQAINQKELELRRRIEAARRKVEAQIQSAREEAKQTIAQADRAGQKEAGLLYECGIEEARQEAETVVAAARENAVALRRQVTANLDEAAGQILQLVLPARLKSRSDTISE